MKKYSLYLITAAALATGMSSCKKELNLQPTDTFSENNAFLDLSDVQLGVNAVYGRYGTYLNDMYVSALVSDEAKLGPDNSGQGALTFRYQYSSDNTSGDDVTSAWGGYYTVIDQCNRVLPKIDQVSTSPAEANRRNQLKGQLLAMRAISHFGLLQAYCKNYNAADPKGVPVMLTSNPIAKPSRNSMGQVMQQIEADLTQAKTLLPPVSASNFSDLVMNRVNIAAYQARIALYKKDYDAAINYATEVISTGARPLAQGQQFSDIWTDDDLEAEVLFRIRFATSTSVGGLWTTTGGAVYIAPSDELSSKYSAEDIRATAYIGEDGSGNRFVNKFFTSGRGGRIVDLKACRIAEMYLIRAEANARKASPDIASAATDLNRLRRARINGYVDETFSNTSALINAIMDERFKELAFEGFRFWDLKRNNMPVDRIASDAAEAWRTLPATSHRFVLPIPNDEILANPNMVQNDNY